MPLLRSLRTTAALWVAPIALILVLLNTREAMRLQPPYWEAASAQAAGAIVVLAPICAALASWEAARHRQGRIRDLAPARSILAVAADALWPIAILATLGYAAALLSVAGTATAVAGTPDWRFLVVAAAVNTAFVTAGYALGSVLRAVYAVPIALIGVLLWLIYPQSLQVFWIRHLTGNYLYACCSIRDSVDPAGLWAPVPVAAAVLVSGLFIVARPRSASFLMVTPILLAGLIAGRDIAAGLGPDPVRARTTKLTCTSRERLKICTWPEHSAQLMVTADVLVPAVDRLTAAGFARPTRLVESAAHLPQEWNFTTGPSLTKHQITYSLASALLPPVPTCAADGPWPAGPLTVPARVWLARTAGLPSSYFRLPSEPDVLRSVDQVFQQPPEAQWQWYTGITKTLSGCDPIPVKVD